MKSCSQPHVLQIQVSLRETGWVSNVLDPLRGPRSTGDGGEGAAPGALPTSHITPRHPLHLEGKCRAHSASAGTWLTRSLGSSVSQPIPRVNQLWSVYKVSSWSLGSCNTGPVGHRGKRPDARAPAGRTQSASLWAGTSTWPQTPAGEATCSCGLK